MGEGGWPARPGIFSYRGTFPRVHPTVMIAPGAVVVGDVEIGQGSSVWFNAVVRGDVNWVRIGSETNIQDLAMLHVTHETHPLTVGNRVTVGHQACLHGCTIGDLCLIGIGAIVLDGAIVESNSLVAAGAVVTPGKIVESGTLVAGVPAKFVRRLDSAELENLNASALRYVEYAEEMMRPL